MTTIQITEDAARCALRFALWERVHNELGDGTAEFYDLSRSAVDDDVEDYTGSVGTILQTLRDVKRVQDATLGESVELEIGAGDLLQGLNGCESYLREDESFWEPLPRAREHRLQTFDAAGRLISELQSAVVA
jgi:hypothetical protein